MFILKNIKDEYNDFKVKIVDEDKDELLPMASKLISKETLADILNNYKAG